MGDILWPNFLKFSMSFTTDCIKSPSVGPYYYQLTDNIWNTRHVHSKRLLIHFPRILTITHRSSLMTYNSEQNYKNASTHFSSPHTSTSAWNNYRDQEVEFDWQTHVSGQMKRTFLPVIINRSIFFFNLKYACEQFVFRKISQSRLQQQTNQDF